MLGEKVCECCAAPMPRREPPSAYAKRKFCSRTCSSSRGLKGKSRTATMVRARHVALLDACECCGGKLRLAVHHVNEDWQDERTENLQTLCVHCHQQWHGLHRRLKIKCARRMPKMQDMPVQTYVKIAWGPYRP